MNDRFWLILGFVLFVVAIVLVESRGYMVEPEVAIRTLVDSGYSDARVVDRTVWFSEFKGCGDDGVAFDCRAKNSQGKQVRLLVCCGAWVKACTVRIP